MRRALSQTECDCPVWSARDRLSEIGHLICLVQATVGTDHETTIRGPVLLACDLIYRRVIEADESLRIHDERPNKRDVVLA